MIRSPHSPRAPFRRLSLALAGTVAAGALALSGCSSLLNPGGSSTITVYSNSLADGRSEWLEEKAKEAGFELSLVDLGGGDTYNRLLAEKANPVADVVFGLNDVFFQNLLRQEVLEAYTPKWADKVDADSVDDSKTFHPIVREPIMLVCTEDSKTRLGSHPSDWPDLWKKPEFAGRYEFSSGLGGATTQVVLSGILSRHTDPSGHLGVSDAGWKEIEQYYQKGSRSIEGTDLFARFKTDEVDCGQMWLAGKSSREKEYGVPTEAIRPAVGVPMVRQSIALIAGSKQQNAAKKFIDWFGSAEVQGAWSKEFFTAPENRDALSLGSTEAIEFTDSFTEQDIDWAYVAERLDSWVEEIQLKYLK